jgi:hypothetical protein
VHYCTNANVIPLNPANQFGFSDRQLSLESENKFKVFSTKSSQLNHPGILKPGIQVYVPTARFSLDGKSNGRSVSFEQGPNP